MKKAISKLSGFYGRSNKQNRYAMILAGGDGTRLKPLTRAISGDERPKQFCPILNNDTLLVQTRRRVWQKIDKANTYFVLTKDHERFYQSMLLDVCGSRKIIQSENKGTAPAILLSLLKLPKDSTVAFFPSDHFISDDDAFMKHVEKAFKAAEMPHQPVILIGIKPNTPETSYGWIESEESFGGKNRSGISKVKRFWEKPAFDKAERLMADGCLWNSFVMVGKVGKFLDIFKTALPDLYKMFEQIHLLFGTNAEEILLRETYKEIGETNFSSEVLEKCFDELYVLDAGEVGWSDWGEPERVLSTLEQLGIKTDWMLATA